MIRTSIATGSEMLTCWPGGKGGGLTYLLTVADMGEGGVKNGQKSADVLYGRPLIGIEHRLEFDI